MLFNETMFRRIMALVLCLAMVLPLCVSGAATESGDDSVVVNVQQEKIENQTASGSGKTYYVIAGSDFQASNNTLSAQNVTGILTAVKNAGYTTMDGLLFAGDYSNGWSLSYLTPGVAALKEAVNGVYPGLADSEDALYLQGNHDVTEGLTSGLLSASGAHDAEGYGVFLINEDDFRWSGESTVDETRETAAELAAYLNEKIAAQYTKPIFVVTHVPLHYTMRTLQNGDSRYAKYLFGVLNQAGAAGLNIIVMYGHNHSASWEDSHGGSAVFYAKGDKLNIPQSQTTLEAKTLNFTYMNAGYVGYYSTPNSGVEQTLTMSLFEITDDTVTVSRYSANGAYSNLKSAGVSNTGYTTYKETNYFSPKTNVVASPKTITLNKTIKQDIIGITVSFNGVTKAATVVPGTSEAPDGYTVYETYDISVDGYTDGTTATVRIPVGGDFDPSRSVVVIDHEKNKTVSAAVSGGAVTFTTDHFSLYTVAQTDSSSTSTWSGSVTQFLQTVRAGESLKTGVPYIISEKDGTGSYKWMLTGETATKTTGSVTSTGLLLAPNGDIETEHVWYYDGTYLRYGSADGQYLLLNYDSSTGLHTVSLSSTLDANAAAKPVQYSSYDQFNLQRGDGTGIYLNRYGGTSTSNVALTYTYDGSSLWYFTEVVTNAKATVSVSAPQPTVNVCDTMKLAAFATVGDTVNNDVTVTWRSLDNTIASVDANGVVTGKKAGQVYIRATLNTVAGGDVTTLVYTDFLLTVVDAMAGKASSSATTHFGQQIGQQVVPVEGGTYFIDFYSHRGWFLSGNLIAPGDEGYNGLGNRSGIEVVNHVPLYDGMWYFDGTNLYHGSSKDAAKAMVYGNSQVTIGTAGTDGEAFVVDKGTYEFWPYIKVSSGKLNLLGGAPCNVPGLYNGSNFMCFSTVIPDRVVNLTVTPGIQMVYAGEPIAMNTAVTVDGVAATDYTLAWVSNNEDVVTVDENGTVTAVSGGTAYITAYLTAIDGVELDTYLPASVQVCVPEITYSGTKGYATVTVEDQIEAVSALQENTPYVITCTTTGDYDKVVTSNIKTAKLDSSYSGFQLMPFDKVGPRYVWYVEKETVDSVEKMYVRFGSLTDDSNYMGVDASSNKKATLVEKTGKVYDTWTVDTYGNYTPKTAANVYLNHHGGVSHDTAVAAAAWKSSWRFNIINDKTVTLSVDPVSANLLVGDKLKLGVSVVVNNALLNKSNYVLEVTSSNPDVAKVVSNNIIPLKQGETVITYTLKEVGGYDYADGLALSIPVTVAGITSIELNTQKGSLPLNASDRLRANGWDEGDEAPVLTVTYSDGTVQQVPVIAAYLQDAEGNFIETHAEDTFENLILTYKDVVVTENFDLRIVKSELPDYPDYPDEGAVFVDKTADGVNFQSSGIGQVELSVNGIPNKKGADVIIMLDTSSSMTNKVDGVERINVLCQSLNNLINGFRKPNDDGTYMDIRVAVGDFNGMYADESCPYYLNPNDFVAGSARVQEVISNSIYTGNKTIGTGAFVSIQDIGDNPFTTNRSYAGVTNSKYTLTWHSGTNYDYAFDAVYELGQAIQDENAAKGEDRELFVIFMSDGCPFQYNYFSSWSTYPQWNNWLLGTVTDEMKAINPAAAWQYYNENGEHWMAEAIMGDTKSDYTVIRKNDYRDEDGDNMITVPGLGATMYSIGFCLTDDNQISLSTMQEVLKKMASKQEYVHLVNTADELEAAFTAISNDILYAASDAYFVDTMGEDYDLLMKELTYELNGVQTTFSDSKIQINSYEIYTMADYELGLCQINQIGVRKTDATGNTMPKLIEEVTFNATGTEAYSDLIFTEDADGNKTYTNILSDGLICGKNFWYNTSTTAAKTITLDNGKTYSLAPETFYWKVGRITTTELALSYYVYLGGAQGENGGKYAGIYDTNENATLYYENYLGNHCYQVAPVPVLAWGQAQVGYGFYLVDRNGNPVVNETTGLTGSFQLSKKLGDVIYQGFTTNGEPIVITAEDYMKALQDAGYELYDPAAEYSVDLNSDGFGRISVTMDDECDKQTTYVTGLTASPETYGDADSTIHEFTDFATANTVVWFAVRPAAKAVPDVIVIDYGLDVAADVLANDNVTAGKGTLMNLGSIDAVDALYKAALATDADLTLNEFLSELDHNTDCILTATAAEGTFGTASVSDGKVRYSLSDNGMMMDKEDTFVYAMKYEGGPAMATGFYYATVTVIPATTIYYEDNFGAVIYSAYTYTEGNSDTVRFFEDGWTTADGTATLQDTDRPGQLNADDADNIYGSDSAYKTMQTFSMGSSMKFSAKQNGSEKTVGLAEFSFTGTGFDIISMTSNTTGTVFAAIYKTDELKNETNRPVPSDSAVKPVDTIVVDTYYGYKYTDSDGDGVNEWVPAAAGDGENAKLYQVPVIKKSGLEYGDYTVILTVTYSYLFDHDQYADQQYDFYLDAIRIYDPANDGEGNKVIKDAYVADNEGWPEYFELRNLLIDRGDLDYTSEDGSMSIAGVAFMDSATTADKTYDITNYRNFGPNNELYLTAGQAIAFKLSVTDPDLAAIHMAMKCAGGTAKVEYYNLKSDGVTQMNKKTLDIATATDLYYDITSLNGNVVVIKNVSGGILSITNVKVTYTAEHEDGINDSFFVVDQTVVDQVLKDLNNATEEEDTTGTSDKIQLTGLSLSLESEVMVNVYYTLNGINADVKNMGLLTWSAKPDEADYDTAETVIKGALTDGSRYMVSTNGISAKEMGDTIYMCVYVDNGNGTYTYGDVISYSPKQYAMSRLEKSSDESLKRLCVALLNYGAEAQKYFTYKTNDLMNAGLTAEQLALVEGYRADMLASAGQVTAAAPSFAKTEGYGSASATLSMDGDIALNYYVVPAGTVSGDVKLYYWSEADHASGSLTEANADGVLTMQRVVDASTGAVSYWAAIDGIAAKELEDVYYVAAVFTADGAERCSGVIPYSVATYCNKKASGSGSMKLLGQTLAVYGYYAAEYFNKEA